MSEGNDPTNPTPNPGEQPPAEPPATPPAEPGDEPPAGDQTDWKARARHWEQQARRNKEKADKFDQIEEESKTELQRATERAAAAEAELAQVQAARERDALVNRIAAEKGVPAALLVGDDEEALEASADALVAWNKETRPGFPEDTGGGSTPPPTSVDSIEAIEDPVARVMARAQNQHLYSN